MAPPSTRGGAVSLLRSLRQWHLLSLDAPTVAALWLLLFAAGQPQRTRCTEAAALALAVWLLYVADRVLDAARGTSGPLQARHRFHAVHRLRFGAVAVLCAGALLGAMAYLPAQVRLGWLILGVPMALYALAIHCWKLPRVPKELIVAVMFAAATTMPALVGSLILPGSTVAAGGLFAVVCWLNCVAIARWEKGAGSPSTAWGARHLPSLCLVVALAGIGLAPWVGVAAFAAGLSALLLLLLHRYRAQVEPVALRALADAALLTPCLFLLIRLCGTAHR